MTTTCTIKDPARRLDWKRYLKTDTLPIKSIIPSAFLVRGKIRLAYMVDLEELPEETKKNLVAMMVYQRNCTERYALSMMSVDGIPILAEGTSVHTDDPRQLALVVE